MATVKSFLRDLGSSSVLKMLPATISDFTPIVFLPKILFSNAFITHSWCRRSSHNGSFPWLQLSCSASQERISIAHDSQSGYATCPSHQCGWSFQVNHTLKFQDEREQIMHTNVWLTLVSSLAFILRVFRNGSITNSDGIQRITRTLHRFE